MIFVWDKLKRDHPLIYEVLEWGCVILSVAAFALSLAVYLR